jgi:hypothetical protein
LSLCRSDDLIYELGTGEILLRQVKLCKIEVVGVGDLQIFVGTHHDRNLKACSFNDRRFVGALEAVRLRFGEGLLEQVQAEALRSLRVNDVFARNGGRNNSAVGGALHLLDGVDGWQADDGSTVLFNPPNSAGDSGWVNQRPDGVVDQDDIVVVALNERERMGDAFLTGVSTLDDLYGRRKAVFGDLGFEAFDLGTADSDEDVSDSRDGGKGAKAVDEDGHAAEAEELFGRPGGVAHSGAEAGCRQDYEYAHSLWSIQPGAL